MPVYTGISALRGMPPKKGDYLYAMDAFTQFMNKKRIVNAKQRTYYAQWVRNLYRFVNKKQGQPLKDNEIKAFIASMGDSHQDWQVKQAEDAIRLYLFFKSQPKTISKDRPSGERGLWTAAVEQMVESMRLKHLALRNRTNLPELDASVLPPRKWRCFKGFEFSACA